MALKQTNKSRSTSNKAATQVPIVETTCCVEEKMNIKNVLIAVAIGIVVFLILF